MKASDINLSGAPVPKQPFLFDGWTEERRRYNPGPTLHNDKEGWTQILETPSIHPVTGRPQIGLDFEFSTKTMVPTIVGIANNAQAVGLRWEPWMAESLAMYAKNKNVELVAYSTTSADKSVLDKALGSVTPLEWWGDGMLTHYLRNQDFCKTPAKGEDDSDSGVMGLMNLWTATSCVSDVPQWKICRGRVCDGACPRHEVFDYCAMDAWGGLEAEQRNMPTIVEKGGSVAFYRELLELTDMTYAMQTNGVRVDIPYAMEMDKDIGKKKLAMFPRLTTDMGIETGEWGWFNPNSPAQGLAYFKEHGIHIESGNKADVQKALWPRARAPWPGSISSSGSPP
jgi:hypothetical protein